MSTSLSEDLNKQLEKFNSTASDSKKKLYAEVFEALKNSGILEKALKKGDRAPDFTLRDQLDRNYSLHQHLRDGPIILLWYRGGWCPYCNITLHHMQAHLEEFKDLGASLVALTPELPDQSLSTLEKHQLEFAVLNDIGNQVAKTFGVVFKLNPEIAKMYQESFGLHEVNGDTSQELPLASTYIIDQEGIIRYAFLHEDYRVRAEPSEIIKTLQNLELKKT